jgi:hypothetical protein
VELALFDEVAEVVRGLVPRDLGELRGRAHRYGVKVWFGAPDRAGPEHYEAQVVGARHVPGAKVLAVEVGFHAEHREEAANEAALAVLTGRAARWRKALGGEAEAAGFLGRESWRRLSETWPDVDLGEPGLALELGTRLTDYVLALEPIRRAGAARPGATPRPTRSKRG